ncbi:MAG: hypothetical protein JWO36_4450 [Myxococcales bacterium]|nr:hypothetical protein [Myxococcales bacterium]
MFGLLACGGTEPTADAGFAGWTLDDLTDSQGFSLRLPPRDVPAGRESQNCYFVKVPDIAGGASVWIDRVLSAMNPGSHHLNVFRVRTISGLDPAAGTPTMLGAYPATMVEGSDAYATNPCWQSANWADWPLVANSQEALVNNPYTDWQLPQDVAIQLVPGEMLMVQSHYVNSGDQPTLFGARVGINFYKHESATPPIELGTLFATQQHIRVCQSAPNPTFSGTCRFPGAVTITAANGHFHKRGQEFDMFSWDGTSTDQPAATSMFYQSNNWNEPPMARGLTTAVASGGGIWWNCKYLWHQPEYATCDDVNAKDPEHQNDCCYTFGGNTDIGEHCNAFVYYYPRGSSDVFCN